MTRTSVAVVVTVISAAAIALACGNGNEQRTTERGPAASVPTQSAPGSPGVEITLRTSPDLVRTGENTFEVTVLQDGKPVTDAAVSAEFFMPAMPSMNMPEMRTKTDLAHVGNGVYRGKGQVSMAGNWDVTVMAMRGGREIGSKKIVVTAK